MTYGVHFFQPISPKNTPHYVVQPVGRTLANLNKYYRAENFFKKLLGAQPHNTEMQLEIALMLNDYGQSFRALAHLPKDGPGLKDAIERARITLGYDKALLLGDLTRSETMLKHHPHSSAALQSKRNALHGLEAPYLAWRVFLNPNTPSSSTVARKSQVDRYVKASEWAEQIPLEHAREERLEKLKESLEIFDVTLRAPEVLTRREPVQASASSRVFPEQEAAHPVAVIVREPSPGARVESLGPLQQGYGEREAMDRVALQRLKTTQELNRLEETVRDYNSLLSKQVHIPPGPLVAVGNALLGLRQPDAAESVFLQVLGPAALASQKDKEEANLGLFWALLEQEKLKEALAFAKERLEEAPDPNPNSIFAPNFAQKRGASNMLGLAYTFSGFLAKGQDHLQRSLEKAPANSEGWLFLAKNLEMRGLPQSSLAALSIAEVHKDTDYISLEMEMQRYNSLMAQREWRKAHTVLERLKEYEPYSQAVKRTFRDWETHNLWETRVYSGWSDNNRTSRGTLNDQQHWSMEWLLYTPPINYNWRAFAGARYAEGRFPEGRGYQKRFVGGLEYRSRYLEAALEAGANTVDRTRTTASLRGRVHIDDHWSVPFSVERDSQRTPLRAEKNDIYANAASVGLTYYWNESRAFNLNVLGMDFSDGNRRLEAGVNLTQRVLTWYTHTVDLNLSGYYSKNSRDDDRPYFNPKESFEAGVSLAYWNTLWRHYDRSLKHGISAGIGSFSQKRRRTDAVWQAGYEQELNLNDRLAFNYGYSLGRRVYDGDSELNHHVFLNLVWRF